MIYKNLLPVFVENSELTQSGLLQCYVCSICSKVWELTIVPPQRTTQQHCTRAFVF